MTAVTSGWCSTPWGKPDQDHDNCTWPPCQCPNHPQKEDAE